MTKDGEYGELMRFLLHFRERYGTEEEFNGFILDSLRSFVYDLRDFDVYISISPGSASRSRA